MKYEIKPCDKIGCVDIVDGVGGLVCADAFNFDLNKLVDRANSGMRWIKFADEMPKEEGWYITGKHDCNCTMIGSIEDALFNHQEYSDTHWLKIEEPKEMLLAEPQQIQCKNNACKRDKTKECTTV